MIINYIENHLNASLITECKWRITNCARARKMFMCMSFHGYTAVREY